MLLVAGLVSALAAGCAAPRVYPLPSGALAIPTDPNLVSGSELGILCTANAVIPDVEGYLQGDPADAAWPVWIEAADGHRQYITWPAGFSARFTPGAELLDEQGILVLTEVRPFTLGQVGASPDLGTKDRPYRATGLWSDGRCYMVKP